MGEDTSATGDGAQPDKSAFVPPTVEELQAALPQYEILAIIGIGGMGAVYKARQVNLDRIVAIKVLPSNLGTEYGFAERFQREAQAMAKMHHQRIVSVHDFGEAELSSGGASAEGAKLLYIVMEFVEGTDLYSLIKTGALDSNQTLAIITQVCDALNYAHDKGIVHRDIKPANVMLDVEGNVKVADFGLAKITGNKIETQLTMTNMAMGTPDYVAPEQLEADKEVDTRADIYSLGVMIYEMLTGAVPRGAFQPPSQKATDPLDSRLDKVVTMAMQSDPDSRYQKVTELWSDVDRIRTTPAPKVPVMAGGKGNVPPKPEAKALAKPPASPAKRKKLLLTAFAAVAGLAVLAVLGYLISKPAGASPDPVAVAATPPPGPSQTDLAPTEPNLRPRKPNSKPFKLNPKLQRPGRNPGALEPQPEPAKPKSNPATPVPEPVVTESPATPSPAPSPSAPTTPNSPGAQPIDPPSDPGPNLAGDGRMTPPEPAPAETDAAKNTAELLDTFRQRFADGPGAAFSAAVAKLNTSYAGALARESEKIAATGNLDAVVAFKDEIDTIHSLEGDNPSSPMLSELPAGSPPQLQTMRETYKKTVAGYAQKRDTDAVPLLREFDKALETLVINLTRAQKIDEALEVRTFRETFQSNGVSTFTGSPAAPAATEREWISLFNGEDLDGWTTSGDRSEYQIDGGIIKVVGGPSFLYYSGDAGGGTFVDFEFKAQVMTEDGANSGIFFHARPGFKVGMPAGGYEIQIFNGNQPDHKTGSIYDVSNVEDSPVRDNQWFELGIRVRGKTITTSIDGEVIVEWTEPEDWIKTGRQPSRRLGSGTFAIQNHQRGGAVYFKDILVRPAAPSSDAD